MTYGSIRGQASMALDKTRNKIYEAALKEYVTKDSVVLDLGAGLGTFGLLAAKLGARKVYLVEPQGLIKTVKNVVRDNNLENIVECIHSKIEDVKLPEKVDIITSAFTGNFLLSENLLPLLFYARDEFLKPNGKLIPSEGTMVMVPLNVPQLHKRTIQRFSDDHLGLDFSYYRKHMANNFYKQRNIKPEHYLCDPKCIKTLEFYQARRALCDLSINFTVSKDGECHGFLGWFTMKLGCHTLSSAPDAPKVHWSPLFFPVDPPIDVKKNERLTIYLKKPAKSSWSWKMANEMQSRTHSATLSMAVKKQGYKITAGTVKA